MAPHLLLCDLHKSRLLKEAGGITTRRTKRGFADRSAFAGRTAPAGIGHGENSENWRISAVLETNGLVVERSREGMGGALKQGSQGMLPGGGGSTANWRPYRASRENACYHKCPQCGVHVRRGLYLHGCIPRSRFSSCINSRFRATIKRSLTGPLT
jgi:hypothetical protein